MRTQCSLPDLALLAALASSRLEKLTLARRAALLVEGPGFDRAVALASVDRLVELGWVRKVYHQYELTQRGRDALVVGIHDHREVLDGLTRLLSRRRVEGAQEQEARAVA